MSDAPRDVRDRLGELLYRVHAETGRNALGWSAWNDHSETVRERWREAAERDLPALAASCGLKIVPDDGDAA